MSGSRILIVDDSLVIRAVVRASLEDEDYVVTEAEDGALGLAECRRNPPDVVLLDVEMPQLTGMEVLVQLKADPALQDIPVVFLTSRSSTDDIVAALRGGAHDYLKKPFETAELLARVSAAAKVKRLQDQLLERSVALEKMARTDVLTGLFNRRHLDDELRRRHSDARRHHEPLSVLLLDIDHFKHVNDTYGHPMGDLVLCEFARILRSGTRDEDVSGRWGGEEFLIILPRTDLAHAVEVGERIRLAVANKIVIAGDHAVSVTVSGGCVVGVSDSVEGLLHQVDVRLYRAKSAGRNQIVSSEPTMVG